jgi:asparagine synthase (glutamine-hydrolysing)
MCGIVGIHGAQDPQWIKSMNHAQNHRGPDDSGSYWDPATSLSLSMRRLSIIDHTGGHQPMVSPDGRFVLVYNGEIFNSPSLRLELEASGFVFSSDHSDTEVLFALLQREGRHALPKLNGMFAFVFFDRQSGRLLCARDRIGIKPLYYTHQSGVFAFASELKSLLCIPTVGRSIDRQSLFNYLSLQYVPGVNSIISGIHRLPPAHCLVYDINSCSYETYRWWHFAFDPDPSLSLADWSYLIRNTLHDAVRRWSLSDVPIGASLSGGLDSSAVVTLASSLGLDIHTFSLGFTHNDESPWNELPLARQIASQCGTKHSEIIIESEILLGDLEYMVYALDEPYGGGLPSWYIFKHMSSRVSVCLTGTGGDELFGNYGKWVNLEHRFLHFLPSRTSAGVDLSFFRGRFFNRYYYFGDSDKRSILIDKGVGCIDTAEILFRHFSSANSTSVRDAVAITDFATQLPDEFLHMTDRFSMSHSVEARTPFLDNELINVVQQIPARLRTARFDYKMLLRNSLLPILPSQILNAPKKGFVLPLPIWLRGRLAELAHELLNPRRLAEQGIFNSSLYYRYVEPHLSGKADHSQKIWTLIMFQIWHKQLEAFCFLK